MLVKIKSDRTKKVIRYKTMNNLQQELNDLKLRGVEVLNCNYYDKTQSWGHCEKLIVICK